MRPSEPSVDAPATDPAGAPPPRQIGGAYALQEEIGGGATGTVWRALESSTGEQVAIKLLRDDLATEPKTVMRFVQERAILRMLRHPHIVPVRELLTVGPSLGLVMDLIPGGSLRRRLRQAGTLAPAEAAVILGQTAAALSHAHRRGVVHRDLKPDNILLTAPGEADPTVRLTDFGVARVLDSPRLTTTGAVIGTPSYLAPEVISGGRPTPAADVYALGVVLFELLLGRPPFSGITPYAALNGFSQTRPDGVPPEAWEIIETCLVADPLRRPTAAELIDRFRLLAETTEGVPARDALHAPLTGDLLPVPVAIPAQAAAPGSAGLPGMSRAADAVLPAADVDAVSAWAASEAAASEGAAASEVAAAGGVAAAGSAPGAAASGAVPGSAGDSGPGGSTAEPVTKAAAPGIDGTGKPLRTRRQRRRTSAEEAVAARRRVLTPIAAVAALGVLAGAATLAVRHGMTGGDHRTASAAPSGVHTPTPTAGPGRTGPPAVHAPLPHASGSAAPGTPTPTGAPASVPGRPVARTTAAPAAVPAATPETVTYTWGPSRCDSVMQWATSRPAVIQTCYAIGPAVRLSGVISALPGSSVDVTLHLVEESSGRTVAGPYDCPTMTFTRDEIQHSCGGFDAAVPRGRRYAVVQTWRTASDRPGPLAPGTARSRYFTVPG
ncbi:serine/threonine-protein kinase [Catenuloplanes japonicus]|uniref:serine/threonine-protein kinase n=1 Tax=Catenuloplanes japonicus TaxID=33876 RepID=UPI00068EAF1C|nr:serine/threonine-protein kinase [Catenuloplanes japonicus]